MGVRFQCPNGHKLHVKAELAGKRGVCPECKARFVVPSFSGGRAAPADAGPGLSTPPPHGSSPAAGAAPRVSDPAASSIVIKTEPQSQSHATPTPAPVTTPLPSAAPVAQPLPSSAPIAQPLATPIAPAAQSTAAPAGEPIVWYIRPASGGQFGPATEEVFRQWVADGRVAADSWVWRTGWADWKAGVEALSPAAQPPPQEPAAAMAGLDVPKIVDASAASPPIHGDLGSAEARRLAIRRRKQRVRAVSAILAVVALVMLTVLVVVLVQ